MAAVELTENSLIPLKKDLRRHHFEVRSSHMDEAIAASLGYKTYAALLTDMRNQAKDPPIKLIDKAKFTCRLQELGYTSTSNISLDATESPTIYKTINRKTIDEGLSYNGQRKKTWRNLMVTAINEGIRQKLFSVRPGDNRWPKGEKEKSAFMYEFELPNKYPVKAIVENMGHDELEFTVAVFPTHIFKLGTSGYANFLFGEAVVTGALERKTGAFIWWAPFSHRLSCRKKHLAYLAGMDVQPNGYGDRG